MMDIDTPTTHTHSFHILDEDEEEFEFESESDDDSSEYSYETIDSEAGEVSSLFTIPEETENDLISRGTVDLDMSDRTRTSSSRSSYIQTPRISLDAYLEKDGRRHQSDNLDVTIHELDEVFTDASESLNPEEACLQRSYASFAFDDTKSFGSSPNAFLQKSGNSLNIDDCKSVDSTSTTGSNRLALLKLQKALSARKLKEAIEAADLTSSFRKEDVMASKCLDSLEESLLKSPQTPRSTENYRKARSKLLSAMSTSKNSLMMHLE